jgi:hypothetical protein
VKTIPIYDATAPIACTADSGEITARLDQIERLHANLQRVERTEHGLLLHFPRRTDIEANVRSFAIVEKACCQFWGFEVTVTDDAIHLRWDAPPSLDAWMDRLVGYFDGDEPITAASGLL